MRAKMALVDVTPQAEAGLTSTCSTLWMGGVARLLRDELWHCMTRKERRLGWEYIDLGLRGLTSRFTPRG